ncbi:MAG TPA: winged helix-turn-helix domain-containing protein [Nitrososphaerales archaeon]|nr:winged helix-turn-helix domain-containing protein [Nitrososphaerales archaeon]
MTKVEMTEMSSRLGKFAVIKLGQTVLISPCDTRMKILAALSKGALTSEAITEQTGVSYSCVMDHMDLLERLGVVRTSLKRNEGRSGRRRIHFHLHENPLEGIEELFVKQTKNGRGRPRQSGAARSSDLVQELGATAGL